MKTLLTILIAANGVFVGLAGVSALLLLWGRTVTAGWGGGNFPPLVGHLFMAFLGGAMIVGIVFSIVSSVAGFILTILELAFKCWLRAALSALLCASGIGLWIYFLSHKV